MALLGRFFGFAIKASCSVEIRLTLINDSRHRTIRGLREY